MQRWPGKCVLWIVIDPGERKMDKKIKLIKIGYTLQHDLPNTSKEWFIHPWRFTWNIIMEAWKIMFLSKWVIWSFHVNLPGHNEYEVDIWSLICTTFLLHSIDIVVSCLTILYTTKTWTYWFYKVHSLFLTPRVQGFQAKTKKSSCSSCKIQLSIFQFQIFSSLSLGTCFSLVMVKRSPRWHDEGDICTKLHPRKLTWNPVGSSKCLSSFRSNHPVLNDYTLK